MSLELGFGGCSGKQRFESKAAAIAVRNAMVRGHRMKRHRADDEVHPYRCDRCRSWHIGRRGMR